MALPEIDDVDRQAVLEALESTFVALGPRALAFEGAFAESSGVRHAIAVSSGTAALHLTLLALGIGSGDEVVVPSLTFVATANAVAVTGAQVVLADISSLDDPCISAGTVEQCVSPRTRAVIAVHYGGVPCEMDRLRAWCWERGIPLIEDAAHAVGASWDGRPVGSLGDAGCFSFFANKNLTTIEGGMVTTDDRTLAERVRRLRSHGMTVLSYQRSQGASPDRDVAVPGWNYRLDDVRAALGLSQLRRLASRNARRAEILERYRRVVAGSGELRFPFGDLHPRRQGVAHLAPLLVEGGTSARDAFVRGVEQDGIQTSHHYLPIHRLSYYRDGGPSLPTTDAFVDSEVSLPLFSRMTDEQTEVVCEALTRWMRS